jgi:cobalamin biosynthesis Mg chelatase CobN
MLPDLEIVDVRLVTAPANSVNATSIITLENPSTVNQTANIRFILDGDVLEERDVEVPAGERINATHSEIVEAEGTHEFVANIATKNEAERTVRTFDFIIGTVEIDDSGTAVSSSSADPPSAADDNAKQVHTDETDNSSGFPLWIIVLVVAVLAAVVAVIAAIRRRNRDQPDD